MYIHPYIKKIAFSPILKIKLNYILSITEHIPRNHLRTYWRIKNTPYIILVLKRSTNETEDNCLLMMIELFQCLYLL